MMHNPVVPCPGKHCGCAGHKPLRIRREGQPDEIRPPSHRIQPTGGTVRVWMLAKFFGVASNSLVYCINQSDLSMEVRSPSSRIDLSDGELVVLLETLAQFFTPVLALGKYEFNVLTWPNLQTSEYGEHLLSCFWLNRKMERMEVDV